MSKIITRKYIQRITKREGDTSIRRNSGGGSGGGGVSQYWVDDNYVSKEFFNRLFEIHDENGDPILPNDVDTEIDNIQAMFGFWTNAYLSALGQNEGGGGAELTLASLADVAVQGVTDGQALVWNAAQGKWVPGQGGGGTDMQTVWQELAATGTQQINKTHLTTALADYLPLAGGTMTSTSLVTNMNADLLDGHHATDFALASAITDMATQTWVSTNYLSKTDAASTYLTKTDANNTYLSIAFFRALFRAYTSGGSEVVPNDGSTSTIDNIKAMFGFWTNSYLSALGSNPGGASLTLSSLSDVSISGATAGQVLTYRNGTWRNETPQGGGGSVTSIVTGGTTYSPTNGVVTLPDNIVYHKEDAYLNASFLKAEYSQKAAQKYIEFWDSAGGWFNFQLGTLYAVSDVKVGSNSVIHAGNIGSQSVNYATSASKLETARTIWGQSFDGTANVSGSLTGVENITSSSYSLRDSSSNPYLNLKIGSQNWYVQSYSDGIYIGSTSSKSLKVDANGNVTVVGTFGVSGATTLSSTLGVTGLITASGGITIPSGKTLTIGDAVLSWDSTNQGIKITKGLYSETFISALGKGSGGSSGISIEAVWTALANSDSSKQINASHLTNALAGYNPTSNFKTINGNSIIGTGDIAVSAGTGTVTSIVTGGTTYSPTNGVVTLPDYIVYTNESDNYLSASFLKAEYSQKAAQKYIEFWDSAGGWFNFQLGTLYAVSDVKVGSNSVIHTGNIGSQSVNYANSASTLTNKSVTTSTIDGLAGSFTFEGNELTTSGYDEVGIQIGSSVDKFQIIGKSGTLLIRQNDNGGTSTSDWTAWTMLPTKVYTRHLLTKTDQWYRVANLTTFGMSYIISIRESYFNREPTPATFIINTSYTNATITQIGRASRTPVSITKVRLVKYGNGTYHVELYTPELSGTSLASMSTSEVNIFNLGRENTSDGIILVHDPSDNTKWLEVDKNIASGETLIEEANISTENYATSLKTSRSLWGQSFDGTGNVSGSLTGVENITSSSYSLRDSSSNPYLNLKIGSQNWYVQSYSDGIYIGSTSSKSLKVDANGNVTVVGTFGVSGATTLSSTLGVTGNTTLSGTLSVSKATTLSSTLGVTGAATLSSTLSVISNTTVGGTLGVTGATTLSSTLSVSGTSTLTGHVGIGTTPHSTYVLRAAGEVYVSTGLYSHGYVTALSDIRHKDIRDNVNLTVTDVANAPSVKFLWKDRRKEGIQVGSIAQYWQKVLPEAIVEGADGELTMSYGVIALLASIATARKVEDLERRVVNLEKENKELRKQLKAA